jgi:hypothetical protein
VSIVSGNGQSQLVVGIIRFMNDRDPLPRPATADRGLVAGLSDDTDWVRLTHSPVMKTDVEGSKYCLGGIVFLEFQRLGKLQGVIDFDA